MSKILSARDLLDLVRTGDAEDQAETENIVDASTLGKRIYPGNSRKRFKPGAHPQAPRRPRQNTELIEPPRTPARPLPDVSLGRMSDDRSPAVPVTRKGTLQMKRPEIPARAEPGREEPGPESDRRAEARTLELPRPKDIDLVPPAKPATPKEDPKRSLSPAQPLRKVSMGVWGRPQDGSKESSRPPPGDVPKPAEVPARATPPAAPAEEKPRADEKVKDEKVNEKVKDEKVKDEKVPPSNPDPATPPRSAVASMFSWVTSHRDSSPGADAPVIPPLGGGGPAPVLPPLGGGAPVIPPLGGGGPAPVIPPLGGGGPAPVIPPLGGGGPAPVVPPLVTAPLAHAPVVPPPETEEVEPSPPSRIDAPRSLIADEPIALSSEETLVLVHYDQSLAVEALAERTGLSEFRVTHLVSKLKKRGVLEGEEGPESGRSDTQPEMSAAPLSAQARDRGRAGTLPLDSFPELAPATERREPAIDRREPTIETPLEGELDAQPTLLELDLNALAAIEAASTESTDADPTYVDSDADLPAASPKQPAPVLRPALKVEEPPPAPAPPPPEPEPEAAEGEDGEAVAAEDGEGPEALSAEDKENEINYLRRFETMLAPLPIDERAKVATMGNGPDLYALCFDKEPEVQRALWQQNINISHEHARFAAFHHRTALGLDLIAQRNEFLKDPQVQRRFIRNAMTGENLLRRILVPKRLIEIYKVTLDREAAERTRASARSLLRNKFATTDSEDRMELIWKTEARALNALSGLSIDSKTAALLCSRQVVSMMLVQNFTRFAATPPSVIAHFLKSPLVKRQIHLRNALLKHPNCPSDAKRAF